LTEPLVSNFALLRFSDLRNLQLLRNYLIWLGLLLAFCKFALV